jgi:hypothetical protein
LESRRPERRRDPDAVSDGSTSRSTAGPIAWVAAAVVVVVAVGDSAAAAGLSCGCTTITGCSAPPSIVMLPLTLLALRLLLSTVEPECATGSEVFGRTTSNAAGVDCERFVRP